MADAAQPKPMDAHTHDPATRRDFLQIAATALVGVGTAIAVWPLIDSMNAAKDTLSLSTTEVDLAPVKLGQRLTVKYRGGPVFIDHRSPADISAANAVDIATLKDPQKDSDRAKKPEWLIISGTCTHLGCVPLGQKPTDPRGEYGGWFCPCHGSQYDTSGRIRSGPAPRNLEVPPYQFLTDTTIKIG
jgi:ubiquinol-cytochrome c reductase iron-sulfur subunit